MHLAWSQFEEAWRDTLVQYAERAAFRRVADLHFFPHPQGLDERSWRRALLAVAYGARDQFRTLFKALEGAFSEFDEVTTAGAGDVLVAAGAVTALYRAAEWNPQHVQRFIRLGDKLYMSTHITGGNTLLHLSPYPSEYFDAAEWGPYGSNQPLPASELRILPFRVYERSPGPTYPGWAGETYENGAPCTVEVILLPYISGFPETFLLAPTEYLTATQGTCPVDGGDVCTPEGFPNNGYLLDDDVDDFPWSDADDIAGPVYLGDAQVSDELEAIFSTVAPSGVRVLLRTEVA